MSPEQGYFVSEGAEECFLSPSTTMDIGIIRDLFPHCIEAGKILNVDKEFGDQLEKALKKIPPYQIGKDGRLQVWIEDWIRGNEGHNESPNFGFFPGNSITLRGNPEIAAAIQKWLEPRRIWLFWNSTWDICYWARLENGVKADTVIRQFLLHSESPGEESEIIFTILALINRIQISDILQVLLNVFYKAMREKYLYCLLYL